MMRKKLASIFLTLCMVMSLVPVTAWATDTETLAAVKAAVEKGTYELEEAEDEAAVKTALVAKVNAIINKAAADVTAADITVSDFAAATEQAAGSFKFTVALKLNSETATAGEETAIAGTIAPSPV